MEKQLQNLVGKFAVIITSNAIVRGTLQYEKSFYYIQFIAGEKQSVYTSFYTSDVMEIEDNEINLK